MLKIEPPTGKSVVAFSGGVDSTALVLALRDAGAPILLAHLDHAMREKSADDANFCRIQAKKWGLPIEIERLNFAPKNEDEARIARYDFLHRVAKKHEASTIALAHHQDDQAESFLLRALRGAGVFGLSAMHPRTGLLWRPFLRTPKSELFAFVQSKNEQWCDDPSNNDDRFLRNFLRLQVMPELQKRVPEAIQNLAKSASLCAESALLIETLATDFVQKPKFSVTDFLALPSPVQHEVFRKMLPRIRSREIDDLHRMLATGRGGVKKTIGSITIFVKNGFLMLQSIDKKSTCQEL